MQIKKILSCALAVMLSLGAVTVLPVRLNDKLDVAITADAASSDLIIEEDADGDKYVAGYKGNGGEVVIPRDVAYINSEAFKGNNKITSITANGNLYVWESAFEGCTKLKKVVVNGNAYFYINAFAFCADLKTVEVKGSVEECIGAGAFMHCSSLRSLRIAKSKFEYSIGEDAFYSCINLKTVDITEGCKEIHNNAFTNCVELTSLTIPENTTFSTKYGKYPVGYSCGRINEDTSENVETRFADGMASVYIFYYTTSYDTEYYKVDWYGLYGNLKKFTPKKITLNVYPDSKAYKFAKNNGISYKLIQENDELTSPENFKASAKTKTTITLKWDKVAGADAYAVYMYNNKTGKYEKYKTVKGNSCVVDDLTKNTKYKFKVAALDKINGKYVTGEKSDPISVTTSKK